MSRFAVTVTIVALVLSISAFGAYLFFDAHLKSADEYPVITLKMMFSA